MSPDTMRRVDCWVGIPACALAALLGPLLPGPRPRRGRRRRVAFLAFAETGAMVLAHPAVRRARALPDEPEVYFVTFPMGAGMLRHMGFDGEHIIVVETGSARRFVASTIRAVSTLRRLGIELTINLEIYSRFSTLLAFASGARTRVGFHRFNEEGGFAGGLNTHRVGYSPHQHITVSFLALVEASTETPDRQPRARSHVEPLPGEHLRISPDPALRERLGARLAARLPDSQCPYRLVILFANASDLLAVRRWPADRYVALARRILATEPDVAVVLTGTAGEAEQTERMRAAIGDPRVVSLAGATTLDELIELFHMASAMVTNDSGPAHFASTTGLSTIVLFGPETPRIFGPVGEHQESVYLGLACSPCVSAYNQKKSACTDNLCMKNIDVDRVEAHLRAALAVGRSTADS